MSRNDTADKMSIGNILSPATVPSRSDTAFVTGYSYNPAGWVQDKIQDLVVPAGIDTRTWLDQRH